MLEMGKLSGLVGCDLEGAIFFETYRGMAEETDALQP